MPRSRHLSPALLSAILAFGVTLAACGDQRGDAAVVTAPPSEQQPAGEDPRIGEGLPAAARFAGVEHNRLTMLMLRQARGRAQRTRAMRAPCEMIVAGLSEESHRTAALAGVPDHADGLSTIMRAFMSTHRECSGRIARPSTAAFTGDAGVTASVHPDSVLTDASLRMVDQMLTRIGSAQSVADITAALHAAAAGATTLGATDALAVQAAVAQSQGSMILWGHGGAGWAELEVPVAAQSLFRTAAGVGDSLGALVAALSADGAGCLGALRFMRALPIVQDPRLLLAACGLVATAGTVYFAYNVYHAE